MVRYFRITIIDRDGEHQQYSFVAVSLWQVMGHIRRLMLEVGDFYGHKATDTGELYGVELTRMDDPNPIRLVTDRPMSVEG